MRLRQTLFFVLLFVLSQTTTYSQTLVNSTGNTLSNNTHVIEYAIGEVGITTIPGTANIITQGLLQPNVKFVPPVCDAFNDLVVTFENPTRNYVRIVGRHDWITHYQVYAMDGKLVQHGAFANNYIDLSRLPAAIYFIRLFPGCNDDFKILKVLKQH
jgi:hypothetical protein